MHLSMLSHAHLRCESSTGPVIQSATVQREEDGRCLSRHTHTYMHTQVDTNTHFRVTCTLKNAFRLMWILCTRYFASTQQVCPHMLHTMFYRCRIQTACTSRVHAYTHLRRCEADSGWTEGCRLVKDEVLQRWWEVHTDSRDWWSLSVRSAGSSEPPSASHCHVFIFLSLPLSLFLSACPFLTPRNSSLCPIS